MFHKVLVANRGAVAARVIRALRMLGVRSVAVYSEADAGAPYLDEADESYLLGPAPAAESYLNVEALLRVMRESGADALHPGYGFLSENAAFASRIVAIGARFIGPSPYWIDAMGHKTKAREFAASLGLPVKSGSGVLGDADSILAEAARIGYPVLVKPAAGGGGIGMLPARDAGELAAAVERSRSIATRGFGSGEVYLEKLLEKPRHIEFQMLGDQHGSLRHLFERDCSVQRRHQKVIEEAGAPSVDRERVDNMAASIAGKLARAGYDNIGTVEMLMGQDGLFQFLEMNTRLQVEHGVTEEVTGIDLVTSQIRLAAGARLDAVLPSTILMRGHSIEARVYAEDPKRFFPSPGKLAVFRPPRGEGLRVETGYAEGREVTPHYDPLLAKVIAWAVDRDAAIACLCEALENFAVQGVKTNIPALLGVLTST
ncbi:MAG: biotin carboxylase N-terminal domain-containing protein, partial [Bryobacteraceae bacterium]